MNFKNNLLSLIIFIILLSPIKKNILNNNFVFSNTKINKENKYLSIKNNVFTIKINKYNNNIENINLLKYKDFQQNLLNLIKIKEQFELINTKKIKNIINYHKKYYTQLNNIKIKYIKNKNFKKIILLSNHTINKIKHEKYLIIKNNSYNINIQHKITNNSNKIIYIKFINKIKQPIINNNLNDSNKYKKISYFTDKKKYQEYEPENIKSENLNIKTKSGWISIPEKYFLISIIPTIDNNINYFNIFSQYNNNNESFNIGYKTNNITIKPKETKIIKYKLWIGPKLSDELNKISPDLNQTINYGILKFLSKPLFNIIKIINYKTHNLGLSVIIITIILKLITYPLNKLQYISLLKIQNIQKKINKIKKKYKYEKNEINKHIINIYKKYRINPLTNLIITLIQIPIFISIYNIINTSIEFKNSPFIFWIKDLSKSDPYFILPILMGLSVFILQNKTSKINNDKINKQIEFITSIIFTVLSLWFSSGLIIHYITNNILTIIQQEIIIFNKKNEK